MKKKKSEVSQTEGSQPESVRKEEFAVAEPETILNAMLDGVQVTDVNGNIIQCNAAFVKMFGFKEAREIIGGNITELIAERALPKVMDAFKKHLEIGAAINFESIGKNKQGEEFPVLLNASMLRDEKGEIVGVLTVLRDLTERKRSEEKLRRRVALDSVRISVYKIRESTDMRRVLIAFHEALEDIGLNFEGCSIQIVDEEKESFGVAWRGLYLGQYKYHSIGPDRKWLLGLDREDPTKWMQLSDTAVYEAWQYNRPIYRRDLDEEDPYNEKVMLGKVYNKDIRSVLDIPFSYGTIAVNSIEPNAFSEAEIEILQQFAEVLSEAYTRFKNIIELKQAENVLAREYRLRETEAAVRVKIASMDEPQDLCKVVEEISNQLKQLGVKHDSCSVQIVNLEGTDFASFVPTGAPLLRHPVWTSISWSKTTDYPEKYPWVIEVWKTGKSRYEPCVPEESLLDTGMSVIDAPFCQGTLAINCKQSNAFSEDDMAMLEHFADILSDGFQRYLDITEHKKAEAEQKRWQEIERMRYQIRSMQEPEEWLRIPNMLDEALTNCGVEFRACGVNIVNLQERTMQMYTFEEHRLETTDFQGRTVPVIEAVVRENRTIYRPDTLVPGEFEEGFTPEEGMERRSVVDVPFAGGTVAMSSPKPDAFSERDIETLEMVANAISEGYIRYMDLAERKRAEKAIQESEEKYRSLVESAEDSIYLVDGNCRYQFMNKIYLSRIRLPIDKVIGRTYGEFHSEEETKEFVEKMKEVFETGKSLWYEHRSRRDGRYFVRTLSPVKEPDGRTIAATVVSKDITERKRTEEQLRQRAFYDTLTGLPNRAVFTDRLGRSIESAKRRGDYLFAVLFMDLDDFKIVNDSLGHTAGDELLVEVARKLEVCLRSADTAARFGGDEFAMLLDDIKDVNDAMRVADRIQKELKSPFKLSGREVFTTASIGIVLSTNGYDRPEDILRDADTAMYTAKTQQGKARHQMFDKSMHVQAVARLQLENDLRRAVERREFRLRYQPIVSLKTGGIIGFEALVRWQRPDHGLVSPADFIPVAEKAGMIISIDRWVLREACRQMRAWHVRFPTKPPLFISTNFSSKQFIQSALIEQIRQVLQETGLDPRSLRPEITESEIMENFKSAISMLSQLKDINILLHLDDFGTGYSSLSYLVRFQVNTLKIDRSFVSNMEASSENFEIIRMIITLAHNLGMDVIAEGVETPKQHAQLKTLKCEYAQGYLFSKPLDSEGAEALLETNPRW